MGHLSTYIKEARGGKQVSLQQEQGIKEHYEIEKKLASRLRESSREERKTLYMSLYDEFNRRVPIYVEAVGGQDIQVASALVSPQWRFLRRFLRQDTIFLEVGSGTCATSLAAARVVKKVYALEVSEEVTRQVRAPEHFELILFDGFNLPVPDGSVTVAYSDQVMEHIHPDDAREQLANIHQALASGGIYICITPNRLNGPHDISQHFDAVATGFHLKEYTNTDLSDLMKQVGFSKVRAYIGIPALYMRFPLVVLKIQEAVLSRLPQRLRRTLARLTLSRCVRLVGVKG
jgi:SAM-dependent methyltransferase